MTATVPTEAPLFVPQPGKARFWDKLARKYATDPISDMIGYERTITRTRELLAPDSRVLEIGCGTGTTALRLAASAGHYVATDVSAEMIAIAREKLGADPRPNLEFNIADADGSLGHERYEAVLAFNLLHLVDDLDGALAMALRAVVPGGLLISKTACLRDMNPLIRLAVPLMRLVGKAPPVLILSESELEAALRRHGVEIVAIEHHASKGKDTRPFIVARKQK